MIHCNDEVIVNTEKIDFYGSNMDLLVKESRCVGSDPSDALNVGCLRRKLCCGSNFGWFLVALNGRFCNMESTKFDWF